MSNLSVAYNALGNITSKTGTGTYTYHATRKHAVVSTSSGGSYAYDANGNMTSRNGSTISWSSFNLPTVIHGSGSNQSQFFYTPDRARYKQVANYSGTTETTIYVGGLLEKLSRGALTEFRHLIQAGQEHTVIYTRRSTGTTDTFHVTRDHLGSAAAITDASGNVLVQESFTAFGARRGANWAGSPSSGDWTQIANTTRRGFTDHEHLDNLNLIHMNGRVYDPGLGRFISADPFIDGWTSTQGYNRYSYVHNNPLRFRDPSGFRKKNLEERNESEGAGQTIRELIVIGERQPDPSEPPEPEPAPDRNNRQHGFPVIGNTAAMQVGDSGLSEISYGNIAYAGMTAGIGRAVAEYAQSIQNPSDSFRPALRAPAPPEFHNALSPLLRVARLAEKNVPKWIPQPLRGTLVHSRFAAYVRQLGSPYHAEVSYKGGLLVEYGVRGSVRADAVYGPRSSPIFIVDLKTGWAYVTNRQAARYEDHLPPGTPIVQIGGK